MRLASGLAGRTLSRRILKGVPATGETAPEVSADLPRQAEGGVASERHLLFREPTLRRFDSLPAVELEGLPESDPKGLKEFLAGPFLAVDTRDLFDPPDPPVPVPFRNGCVSVCVKVLPAEGQVKWHAPVLPGGPARGPRPAAVACGPVGSSDRSEVEGRALVTSFSRPREGLPSGPLGRGQGRQGRRRRRVPFAGPRPVRLSLRLRPEGNGPSGPRAAEGCFAQEIPDTFSAPKSLRGIYLDGLWPGGKLRQGATVGCLDFAYADTARRHAEAGRLRFARCRADRCRHRR